jgi:hypothetical protein
VAPDAHPCIKGSRGGGRHWNARGHGPQDSHPAAHNKLSKWSDLCPYTILHNPNQPYSILTPPSQSYSALLSPTQSCSILLNPTQSYPILLNPTRSHSILHSNTQPYPILLHPTQSYPTLLDPIPSYSILFNPTRSYSMLANPTQSYALLRIQLEGIGCPRGLGQLFEPLRLLYRDLCKNMTIRDEHKLNRCRHKKNYMGEFGTQLGLNWDMPWRQFGGFPFLGQGD